MTRAQTNRATYAIRERFAAVPFGSGPNELERTCDYVEVDGPEQTAVAADGRLWVRNGLSGKVSVVDPAAGAVARVDLGRHALAAWGEREVTCVALASSGASILVLAAAILDRSLDYALFTFSQSGAFEGSLALPDVRRKRPVSMPTSVARDEAGQIWIGFLDDHLVLSPEGERLRFMKVPGVLTSSGHFVTSEPQPRLFGEGGALLGDVTGFGPSFPGRFLFAGPPSLLFCWGDTGALSVGLAESLVVLDVYLLDTERRAASLQDRVIWPAARQAKPAANDPIGDALPIESEFQSTSLTCDAEGNLYILEHAPPTCFFYRHRLIKDPADPLLKFASPAGLSPAELALHRAEARARAPGPKPENERDPAFDAFFEPCAFSRAEGPAGASANASAGRAASVIATLDATAPERPQ